MDGVIVVDKPEGWTSHDVVSKMRGIAGTRRVGHLGTLDPIATGVLPLMIGQATTPRPVLGRIRERLRSRGAVRVRHFDIRSRGRALRAGHRAECHRRSDRSLSGSDARRDRANAAAGFGEKDQRRARLQARAKEYTRSIWRRSQVSIYELTLLEVEGAQARLRVRCSAGTYVRSIAHQLGILAWLRRAYRSAGAYPVGPVPPGPGVHARAAAEPEETKAGWREALVPMSDLLPEFPGVFVDDITATHIRQGRDFNVSPFRVNAGSPHVKAIGPDGRLVAIGRIAMPHVYHPVVVMGL